MVERRQHLRRQHRVTVREHEHRRAELHALGGARDHGERRERIEEVRRRRQREVAAGVVRIPGADLGRDHDVIARPHGVEPQALHAARERDQRVPRGAGAPDRQVTAELDRHRS
jgi:hypothetical protein